MERAVEIVVMINLAVIGLSHISAHRAWGEFFERLAAAGRPGAFANGFLTLLMGSIVVGCHNVWSGIPVAVTLLGWAWVVKSLLVFTVPDWGVRSMRRVTPANSRRLLVPGVVMLLLAGLLLMHVVQSA